MTSVTEKKRISILYIEDNPSNRNLVRYILDEDVFDYCEAVDASTGIIAAKEIIPDIILMDINMTGMSGLEATIKIRQIPELSHIVIIAVTAKIMKGDRERILAAGCNAYIPKPIDVDTFQSKVIEVFKGGEESLNDDSSIVTYMKQNQAEIVDHLENEISNLKESRFALRMKVKELEEKNIELEHTQSMLVHSEKLAALGQLVAGIIHEIRTPLAGIMGYQQLLMDRIQDEEQKMFLDQCVKAVEKIKTIVSDMLHFSKREQKNHNDIISNKQVFENIQSLINILSKQEGIGIQIVDLQEAHYFKGNVSQVEQVLISLVSNAIFAVTEVNDDSAHIDMDPKVFVKSWGDGSKIFFEVRDKGVGMSKETMSKIFEPFFTTKPLDKGTGLGLSICKTIVDSFNGDVSVSSKMGEGTTFLVSFPIRKTRDFVS